MSNREVTTPTSENIAAMRLTGLTQFAFASAGAIATIGAPPPAVSKKAITAATYPHFVASPPAVKALPITPARPSKANRPSR